MTDLYAGLDVSLELTNVCRRWGGPLLSSLKTGSFETGVFRGNIPWLGGAEDDEGIEVLGCAEGVHFEAGGGRNSRRGDLPSGRDQPGDLVQLEEEVLYQASWCLTDICPLSHSD